MIFEEAHRKEKQERSHRNEKDMWYYVCGCEMENEK